MIRSRVILLHPTLGRALESTAPATEHPVIPVSVRSTIKSCCTIANDRRLSGRCKGAAVAATLTKIAAARPG